MIELLIGAAVVALALNKSKQSQSVSRTQPTPGAGGQGGGLPGADIIQTGLDIGAGLGAAVGDAAGRKTAGIMEWSQNVFDLTRQQIVGGQASPDQSMGPGGSMTHAAGYQTTFANRLNMMAGVPPAAAQSAAAHADSIARQTATGSALVDIRLEQEAAARQAAIDAKINAERAAKAAASTAQQAQQTTANVFSSADQRVASWIGSIRK